VVGQDHVTGPLRRALENDRVHHAYLFSGPRGCGKTSTARIVARSLNCEQGPTPDPCGVCQSCIDLAANGPGSIDVIELDAASHGKVEDTRELRERAMFAPVSSRYKIFIIDEAHMVTNAGFNALLKLVEEPPPHVRFIFATTEADKVLPTIRSRTHNYTFRLVPVRLLQQHLAEVCEREGVPADPKALALIARAGAGSVRDSMSVLGQVIAGSGPDGVTYSDTVSQLGVTDRILLDETIEALLQQDGGSLFRVIDRVTRPFPRPHCSQERS
jgi:DNA polymerase III subunit gamma/tau